MRFLLGFCLLWFTREAIADLIVSAAVKSGSEVSTDTVTTNTNTTTTTINRRKKKKYRRTVVRTSYSESETEENTEGTVSPGVLVQYAPTEGGLCVGAGYFQDKTGVLTLGWRFK